MQASNLPRGHGNGDSYAVSGDVDAKIAGAYAKELVSERVDGMYFTMFRSGIVPWKAGKDVRIAAVEAVCGGVANIAGIIEACPGRAMAREEVELVEQHVLKWDVAAAGAEIAAAMGLARKLNDAVGIWRSRERARWPWGLDVSRELLADASAEDVACFVSEVAADNGITPLMKALFAGVELDDLPW